MSTTLFINRFNVAPRVALTYKLVKLDADSQSSWHYGHDWENSGHDGRNFYIRWICVTSTGLVLKFYIFCFSVRYVIGKWWWYSILNLLKYKDSELSHRAFYFYDINYTHEIFRLACWESNISNVNGVRDVEEKSWATQNGCLSHSSAVIVFDHARLLEEAKPYARGEDAHEARAWRLIVLRDLR